jgi:hypothetical protein
MSGIDRVRASLAEPDVEKMNRRAKVLERDRSQRTHDEARFARSIGHRFGSEHLTAASLSGDTRCDVNSIAVELFPSLRGFSVMNPSAKRWGS